MKKKLEDVTAAKTQSDQKRQLSIEKYNTLVRKNTEVIKEKQQEIDKLRKELNNVKNLLRQFFHSDFRRVTTWVVLRFPDLTPEIFHQND